MLRLGGHRREKADLRVRRLGTAIHDDPYVEPRKVMHDLARDGESGVALVFAAEEDLELGIILAAERGEVLVGAPVQSADRLENADRKPQRARASRPLLEKTACALQREGVVADRREAEQAHDAGGHFADERREENDGDHGSGAATTSREVVRMRSSDAMALRTRALTRAASSRAPAPGGPLSGSPGSGDAGWQ